MRERHDDFAWENDRVAHRMYGPDLEIWKKEPLTSSGIDVWVKRAKRLVVNDWYMTDDYHRDNGDGADFYSVSKSRGCGGIARLRRRQAGGVAQLRDVARAGAGAAPGDVRARLRAVRRGRRA